MKSWTYLKETKSYLDEEGNEYIIRAGRPIKISSSDKTKDIYFRGLQNKYDPNYDKSKLDNPNGYESWTDSYDLAKEYAGKDGYVYSIEINKDQVNKEDIFDKDGERSLMYSNDKPVALREVSGEEYMLYTDHDNWKDLDYNMVSSPENDLTGPIEDYQYGEYYQEVNSALRNHEELDSDLKESVSKLDEATSLPIKEDTLYRVVDQSMFPGDIDDYLHKEIHEDGFMSTTKDEYLLSNISENLVTSGNPLYMRLNIDDSVRGADFEDFEGIRNPAKEVLLQRGLDYKINKIYDDGGKLWIEADVTVKPNEKENFKTNYLTNKYDESYFEDKYAEMSDVSYDKLTSNERNLINDHYVKQEESYDINDEVRNGDLESHKDVVNALDKATHTYKTDEDLTLKRFDERKMLENVYGIKEGLSRDEIYNEMLNHIGETRDEKAYLSASLDESGNGMWNNLLVHSEINVPKGTDMYVADNIFEKEVILPRDTELVLKGVEFKESSIPGMEREYGKIVLQYDLVKKDSKELKSDGFSVRYLDNNGEELQVNASSREEADILKEQLNRGRIYDSDGNLVQSDREPREVLPKNDKVREPRLSNSEVSRLERLLYNNPDEKELRDFIKETELPWNYSDKNKTKQELWMMLKWQLEKEKELRK